MKVFSLAVLALLAIAAASMAQTDKPIPCPPRGSWCTFPVILKEVKPDYTEDARRARLEGIVLLSTMIGVDGVPTQFRVDKGLGMGLDEKAVESVKRWKFKPGSRDGKVVAMRVGLEVRFKLR